MANAETPAVSSQQWLAGIAQMLPLLDKIPNVRFFAMDASGVYVAANQAFLQHHALESLGSIVGCHRSRVALPGYGPAFSDQDLRVLVDRHAVDRQMQLHLDASKQSSWCLALKSAVYGPEDDPIGMMATFIELRSTLVADPYYSRIKPVFEHIRKFCARPISSSELTAVADLSVAQLERECKRIFNLTPRQLILAARVELTEQLLRTKAPIAEIAAAVGYTDHSAFTRQFKTLTGFSPRQFRQALLT